jgi:hypothetical protein
MAQLFFEVHRALPVLPPGTGAAALITEIAEPAVSGRAGTGTVCVTALDVTDVTSLGVRASDGGSIYRPPHEDRYTTLDHLDTEEQILAAASRAMPQAVTEAQARAAVTATSLNAEQGEAVVRMLTATTAATALVAPAGAGKSHTMAAFAGLWELLTGRRVIGLPTAPTPPGSWPARVWPSLTTSPSFSAKSKAATSSAGPSRSTPGMCS